MIIRWILKFLLMRFGMKLLRRLVSRVDKPKSGPPRQT